MSYYLSSTLFFIACLKTVDSQYLRGLSNHGSYTENGMTYNVLKFNDDCMTILSLVQCKNRVKICDEFPDGICEGDPKGWLDTCSFTYCPSMGSSIEETVRVAEALFESNNKFDVTDTEVSIPGITPANTSLETLPIVEPVSEPGSEPVSEPVVEPESGSNTAETVSSSDASSADTDEDTDEDTDKKNKKEKKVKKEKKDKKEKEDEKLLKEEKKKEEKRNRKSGLSANSSTDTASIPEDT